MVWCGVVCGVVWCGVVWCGVVWSWAGAAGDRGGGGNRAAAGRRGRRVTCCFVFSAPVLSALPQGGRPGPASRTNAGSGGGA